MARENISASVESTTIAMVDDLAKKEKRSFSWMVDHLLQIALKTLEEKK